MILSNRCNQILKADTPDMVVEKAPAIASVTEPAPAEAQKVAMASVTEKKPASVPIRALLTAPATAVATVLVGETEPIYEVIEYGYRRIC